MDTYIPQKRIHLKSWFVLLSIALLIAMLVWLAWKFRPNNETIRVPDTAVAMHHVTRSVVSETIHARAIAIPSSSHVLTALSGGNVTQINRTASESVLKGDVIAELSNHNLVMETSSRISFIAEQISNLRSLKLSIESQQLNSQLDYSEAKYNMNILSRELAKKRIISSSGYIEENQIHNLTDKLEHWQTRYKLLREFLGSEMKASSQHVQVIDTSIEELFELKALVSQGLDQLVIRSPFNGVVSELDIKIGQNIATGQTIGLVDQPSTYHLEAQIGEYYLHQIHDTSLVTATIDGKPYALTVKQTSKLVKNGKFKVKFEFKDLKPDTLTRGQSIAVNIQTTSPDKAFITQEKAIVNEDGHQYLYHFDPATRIAVRSKVKARRLSNKQVELFEGVDREMIVITLNNNTYTHSAFIKVAAND
ncbi:efflux RND transporter periplasmic adaptor subunit [Vibrio cionasavignyae]|uniref:efflux RND transporter periplasmic adaptor subunit n=1 Tax=Vibrio cionasavignyae TaxID=2910252 RepID=UPI003D14381B